MAERRKVMVEAVRAAAKALLCSVAESIEVLVKSGESDGVTAADLVDELSVEVPWKSILISSQT